MIQPTEPPLIADALDLARERATEGVTVADLAAHVGYSPFHFSRLFSTATGISPGHFVTALQMDAAKRLLLDGDAAVIDVATAVGFDSLSSFSRRFKSTVGVTPGGLRQLADRVADRPPRPFRISGDIDTEVTVHLDVPAGTRPPGEMALWVGWYSAPVPVGLPNAGALVTDADQVVLPLCPGAPWLLGFAVPTHAGPRDHLTPTRPLVARLREPITAPGRATLRFALAGPTSPPLLSALPSLCRI